MTDGDYEIDILDTEANVVSKKLRKDVVKGVDIYHAVYGVVVTADKHLVISVVGNPAGLPNLHAGKMGCTCATIRRSGESASQAMIRATTKELNISSEPTLISEGFVDIDNTKRLISFYIIQAKVPSKYNKDDIEKLIELNQDAFKNLTLNQPEDLTPPLKMFWSIYNR